jgi:lysophospholipase L1-like esterase
MPTIFRNLVLLACGLVLGVALSEVALRYLALLNVPMGVPNLSGYGASIDKPEGRHFHSTNRYGYRTLDIAPDEVGRRKVVAVIGDSHTNGVGVNDDERLTERLQRSLDPGRKRLLFLNLGIPGSSFHSYLRLFDFAARYDPVLVLLVLYSGNDLVENVNGNDRAAPPEPAGNDFLLRRLRQLHIYHLVVQALRPAPPVTTLGAPPCQMPFSNNEYGAFQQQLQQSCAFMKTHAASWQRQVEQNSGSFLQDLGKSRVPVRMVVLPSKLLVEPEKAGAQSALISERWGLPLAELELISRNAHDLIVRDASRLMSCRAGEICVRDLLPALRQAAHGATLFYPRDWHLSPEGHSALHDAVLEDIRRALQNNDKASAKLPESAQGPK